MIRVNFGSGPLRLPGWINVDLDASTRPDVVADLVRDVPFATGSVDYVFSEDLIAYLGLEGCRHFLAECRRILKPHGAARVLTPDFARLLRMYVEAPDALVELWRRSVGVALGTGSAGEVVNLAIRYAGHFQYDGPMLEAIARDAGFDAVRVRFRESRHGALAGLDFRRPEESVSMYYELQPRAPR
jgi:SAM-dependent methyltransferase